MPMPMNKKKNNPINKRLNCLRNELRFKIIKKKKKKTFSLHVSSKIA